MLLTTAALCMALNIYHEARGEDLTGQHAVAQVTMNRAGRDPNKVCNVVTEKKQFSWTNRLVRREKGRPTLVAAGTPKDKAAWTTAQNIASVTLKGWVPDFTHGAIAFHTTAVKPFWRKSFKLVAVIGNHKFYA